MNATTHTSTAPHLLSSRRAGHDTFTAVARLVAALASVPARVEQLAAGIGDQLHAADDARAEADGLEVTSSRWGGRSYRHPGFPITTTAHTTRQETNR